MFQGLPVPDGGVRGERSCSQGQTRAMAAGLRQPHPCAGPWLGLSPRSGRPARPAGQHGLGVVAAWPGLVASQQEPRGLSGDPALFHGSGSRSILGSGPGAFQDEGILLLQRRLERQAGPRGPGSLGKPRSAFPCWIPPALDAVGACVCEEQEDEQRAAGRPGRGCCPGPGRGEKLAGGAGTVGWSLGSPLRPSVLSEAPGERREQGGSGGGRGRWQFDQKSTAGLARPLGLGPSGALARGQRGQPGQTEQGAMKCHCMWLWPLSDALGGAWTPSPACQP